MKTRFVRCGDLYIYFDENNISSYAFKVNFDFNIIESFINLRDKMPAEIFLPNINEQSYIVENNIFTKDFKKASQYLKGNIIVGDNCFKGIKKLKIIVPFNFSVSFDLKAFDKDAVIEISTLANMGLIKVNYTFQTAVDEENECWILLGQKNLLGKREVLDECFKFKPLIIDEKTGKIITKDNFPLDYSIFIDNSIKEQEISVENE